MQNLSKYRISGKMRTTSSGKLLYMILLDIIGTNSHVVVSQRQISTLLGLSKSTVGRTLRKLERGGYIRIEPQYNEYGGRMPSKYFIQ